MGDDFDYVIVGGGSAGCVLAARLTERLSTTVLLLEAGPDWRALDAASEIRSLNPSQVIGMEKFDDFQWPTLRAARVDGQRQRLFWRGRGLGGSSAINGIIAIRPVPDDWNRWAQPGWDHDEVLPALCRLEADADFGNEPFHGANGPVPIFRMPREQWGPIDQALWEGAVGLGYGTCEDHNAPTGTGVSPYAINGDPATHERVTTNDAYLEPIRDRPNLTIIGDALVDRVVLDGTNRATGVRVRVDDEWRTIEAGEVVLAAGAVHSPAILLRSGIGPTTGLPVGQGLQDHANAVLFLDYEPGQGPATPSDRHTNCCVRYTSGLADAGENDMMMVAMNQSPRTDGNGLLVSWINQSFSRGSLRLASSNPEDQPIIEENMLADHGDLVRLRDAVRRMIEIARQPSFDHTVAHISIDMRGTQVEALDSDADIDAWLRKSSSDAQHICATAAMGHVVDAECRVLGYEGLRIIDASVIPEVPRANTHLMVLALAETMATRL